MKAACARLTLSMALLLAMSTAWAGEQRPFVRESFTAIRATYAGKPLIVHVWSLTCAPCLTELPEWGRIAAKYKDISLVLIEADQSTNRPDRRSLERLKSAGLEGMESWVFADRFEDRLRFEIDPDWQGELPRTLLITASGTVTSIAGSIDPAQVERWIAEQQH